MKYSSKYVRINPCCSSTDMRLKSKDLGFKEDHAEDRVKDQVVTKK